MSQPTGVMVVGAEGRMGLEVRAALEGEPTLSFAGALERAGHETVGEALVDGVVLQDDPKRALEGCGVAIDFSIPAATLANLRAAADAGVAYVTGTTGFDEAGKAEIARFGGGCFHSPPSSFFPASLVTFCILFRSFLNAKTTLSGFHGVPNLL